MISNKHKFIFTHIPKTAGKSIRAILEQHCEPKNRIGSHVTCLKLCNGDYVNLTYPWEEYFSFTVVRNPWARMLSLYFHNKKRYTDKIDQYSRDYNFSEYIEQICCEFVKISYTMSQLYFFTDGIHNSPPHKQLYLQRNRKVKFDRIFAQWYKFEELNETWFEICEKIGIKYQKLPHIDKGKHSHYTEYYDTDSIESIRYMFEDEINFLGYEYGE
jgi:hypothetical protein